MHFWMKRFFTAHSLMALLLNVFLSVPIYMRNSLFDDGPYNIILKLCPTRWKTTRVKFFITNRECPFVHAMSTGKGRADSFI